MTLTRPKLMKTAPSTSAVFLREGACKGPKARRGGPVKGRSGAGAGEDVAVSEVGATRAMPMRDACDEQAASGLIARLRANGSETGKRRALDELAEVLAPFVHDSKFGVCFAWGSGSNFQLGETGAFASSDETAPRRVEELPASMSAVATAKLHTAVLGDTGALYTCGWNQDQGRKARLFFRPVAALNRLRVSCVAISDHHTLALVDRGVYSWGSNSCGQLGLGVTGGPDSEPFQAEPRKLAEIRHLRMVSASAGPRHSVLVQDDGSVWTFGCNSSGTRPPLPPSPMRRWLCCAVLCCAVLCWRCRVSWLLRNRRAGAFTLGREVHRAA